MLNDLKYIIYDLKEKMKLIVINLFAFLLWNAGAFI